MTNIDYIDPTEVLDGEDLQTDVGKLVGFIVGLGQSLGPDATMPTHILTPLIHEFLVKYPNRRPAHWSQRG